MLTAASQLSPGGIGAGLASAWAFVVADALLLHTGVRQVIHHGGAVMRTADDHAYLDAALPARAWSLFLRAHALAGRRIEAELIRRHDLPLPSYYVLEALDSAPGRRLRMAELAARVALSRSGVSRVVDRLEREALVQRQHCDDDLRGTYAVLTHLGRQTVVEAGATHAACVRAQFGTALGADGARALVQVLTPLVATLAADSTEPPPGGLGPVSGRLR